jgi:hypothetical protein
VRRPVGQHIPFTDAQIAPEVLDREGARADQVLRLLAADTELTGDPGGVERRVGIGRAPRAQDVGEVGRDGHGGGGQGREPHGDRVECVQGVDRVHADAPVRAHCAGRCRPRRAALSRCYHNEVINMSLCYIAAIQQLARPARRGLFPLRRPSPPPRFLLVDAPFDETQAEVFAADALAVCPVVEAFRDLPRERDERAATRSVEHVERPGRARAPGRRGALLHRRPERVADPDAVSIASLSVHCAARFADV